MREAPEAKGTETESQERLGWVRMRPVLGAGLTLTAAGSGVHPTHPSPRMPVPIPLTLAHANQDPILL